MYGASGGPAYRSPHEPSTLASPHTRSRIPTEQPTLLTWPWRMRSGYRRSFLLLVAYCKLVNHEKIDLFRLACPIQCGLLIYKACLLLRSAAQARRIGACRKYSYTICNQQLTNYNSAALQTSLMGQMRSRCMKTEQTPPYPSPPSKGCSVATAAHTEMSHTPHATRSVTPPVSAYSRVTRCFSRRRDYARTCS